MHTTSPTAQITVPSVGPVFAHDRKLWTVGLRDLSLNRGGAWRGISAAIAAATRGGLVLCARPYDGHPAGRFGLTLAEADDLAHYDESLVVAVDPYDNDGNLVVVRGVELSQFSAHNLGKAA